MIVIPERLPKTRLILVEQSETANPLGARPEVEVRNQQSRGAAVLGSERLSFIGIDHPRLPTRDVFHRKIRSVATITKGNYVFSMVIDLCQQCIDRDPLPICVQFGPLRH